MEPFKSKISPDLVRLTGRLLGRAMSGVDAKTFADPIVPQLAGLELKQRVNLLADALHSALPSNPKTRKSALLSMLHPDDERHWNANSDEEGLCGWGIWPLTTVIGQHGLGSTQDALEALREMTKRGTSEFDVRPFILTDQDTALRIIASWADDPNHHVRRLVSEGTRPRLPWGVRLHALARDPSPMLPILEHLRDDTSEYVRRSVANHLNDIAKDHPDLVADLARTWMKDADPARQKLLRHACRTLLKQGHIGALSVFGFNPPKIETPEITLTTCSVEFGGCLEFELVLRSTGSAAQRLAVDYVIHHRKADGSLSPKVFKWTTLTLASGEERRLNRTHPFRAITTRRYYPGTHTVGLRINGSDFLREAFELMMVGNVA